MKSHLKSDGKFFLFNFAWTPIAVLALALALGGPGCAQFGGPAAAEKPAEVSLKSDQKSIDDLRRRVPEEKRERNDELAVVLSMMYEVKERPEFIRDRFERLMRQRQDEQRKETQKNREQFSREERERREEFLDGLKREREEFKRGKPRSEANAKFFADQDLRRRDFFANERDARRDFESNARQVSQDFQARMREWKKHFEDEHRIYTRKYKEAREANGGRPPGLGQANPPTDPARPQGKIIELAPGSGSNEPKDDQ